MLCDNLCKKEKLILATKTIYDINFFHYKNLFFKEKCDSFITAMLNFKNKYFLLYDEMGACEDYILKEISDKKISDTIIFKIYSDFHSEKLCAVYLYEKDSFIFSNFNYCKACIDLSCLYYPINNEKHLYYKKIGDEFCNSTFVF